MSSLVKILAVALVLVCIQPAIAQEKAPPSPAQKEATKAESVKRDVVEQVDAIRAYSETQRTEALERARAVTADLDRRIETLQAMADERRQHISQTARSGMDATLRDIRKKRNDVAEWYGGMRHGSDAAWNEVKAGFVESYGVLSDAMRRAREQFERERAASQKDQKADE